jgi:hypothetical protein
MKQPPGTSLIYLHRDRREERTSYAQKTAKDIVVSPANRNPLKHRGWVESIWAGNELNLAQIWWAGSHDCSRLLPIHGKIIRWQWG